jgi:anaerobic ribonucleoside-triphosphate reductase activating protein
MKVMPELTLLIDERTGTLLLDERQVAPKVLAELTVLAGVGQETGCARPLEVIRPAKVSGAAIKGASVRIAGYYHNALVEGPGRRSAVLFQSCPLACPGCWVPHLHGVEGGELIAASKLAECLLEPSQERDGVSLLGGEPFAQASGLLALIKELRVRGCQHILCYSGYTLESLRGQARREPAIHEILADLDLLIDGAYREDLAEGAGEWSGSGNQRVIDMRATRQTGEVVLY